MPPKKKEKKDKKEEKEDAKDEAEEPKEEAEAPKGEEGTAAAETDGKDDDTAAADPPADDAKEGGGEKAEEADAKDDGPPDAPEDVPSLGSHVIKKKLETHYQAELMAFQGKLQDLFSQKRALEEDQVKALNEFNGRMKELISEKTELENQLKTKTKDIKNRIKKFQETERDHENSMGDLSAKISDVRNRKDKNQAQYYQNFLEGTLLHESSFRRGKGSASAAAGGAKGGSAAAGGSYPPTGLSEVVADLPDWIKTGCGDDEYICEEKDATFPPDVCPDKMPDLSEHNNIMASQLKKNPDLYDKLKDLKTKNGITFAKCIKTGMDNKGHPMIKTVGMVAGDEESYETFKDLFDPVIAERHNGYAADAIQPTNLDLDKLDKTKIDPSGKIVLTTRVRTGRSIRGFALPPSCSFEERRAVEKNVVDALMTLEGDLAGEYFPLHGSRSWADKPGGMSEEKEDELRSAGNLFQHPDSTLLLSSGMGRHWPDGRGIFHNTDKNFFVWLNEEDHTRIVSMQKGDNIQEVVARFIRACDAVQKVLKDSKYDFMWNEHLGYILTCPSNLGTGLRAGAMMKIPLLSARKDFKDLVFKMKLQARGGRGVDSASEGGIYDISNKDRIGLGEIDLVNLMIKGTSQFVLWEQALQEGKDIDAEIKAIMEEAVDVDES